MNPQVAEFSEMERKRLRPVLIGLTLLYSIGVAGLIADCMQAAISHGGGTPFPLIFWFLGLVLSRPLWQKALVVAFVAFLYGFCIGLASRVHRWDDSTAIMLLLVMLGLCAVVLRAFLHVFSVYKARLLEGEH